MFENEKLVKVFYAASADILWLQRDFGIKVQNLCDLKEIADKSDISKEYTNIRGRQFFNKLVGKSLQSPCLEILQKPNANL